MPIAVTYPGVYVQPLIGQAPTAQGVATSITAFVGRTFMGPINEATTITCFADFERLFGGLAVGYPLSYAVNDFFGNGGGQAIIVRLFAPLYTPAEYNSATIASNAIQAALPAPSATATGAAALKAVAAAVAKIQAGGDPVQTAVANQIQAAFQAQVTPTMGAPLLGPAEQAALQSVVRPTVATLTVNQVNTVQAVAQEVYGAALAAAAGAPNAAPTVNIAIGNAIATAGAGNPPAATTAMLSAMAAAVNAQLPKAPAAGSGTWLALQTAAAIPAAAATALALSTNPALQQANTDFQVAQKAVTAGVQAAVPGATPAAVLTAIEAAAKGQTGTAATAVAQVVDAAQAAVTNGADANGTAAAGALGSLAAISGDWPSTLQLVAASQGSWGNGLAALVDYTGQNPASGLFNLTISYTAPNLSVTTEVFRGVTTDPTQPASARLDMVLAAGSTLVAVPPGGMTATPPDAQGTGTGSGGSDSNALGLTDYLGDQSQKTGLYALDQVPIFNILCIPPDQQGGDTPAYIYQVAAEYCADRLAMLIMDPPEAWTDLYETGQVAQISLASLGSFSAAAARSTAVYFPRMIAVDPLQGGQQLSFPASGAIAGIWAATDVARGVWKAPAGLAAGINAIVGLEVDMTDPECGLLNPQGINCLRTFPGGQGTVVWGARTLRGADALEDQYKYIPVQRTLLYISASLLQNTKWAVFEPNDEPLWAELTLSVDVFMKGLFRQGAFQGQTASQAYFVQCDATTTTQADIDAGVVNVKVGFAPLKPAEFVVITIQQIAGQ